MISIVNYGLGNLGSIQNMLAYLRKPARIIDRPEELRDAEKVLLPGVGAFDAGMANLREGGWIDALNETVLERKIPVLGICLGMQLMTEGSEEGTLPGLGWIQGRAHRFPASADRSLKVPHMGWSDASPVKPSPLFPDPDEEQRFYFVHSYYVKVVRPEDELLRTEYGIPFTSGFAHENLLGVQFHPEKSHRFGMAFLKNFADAV